jgi:hypothetical protein
MKFAETRVGAQDSVFKRQRTTPTCQCVEAEASPKHV